MIPRLSVIMAGRNDDHGGNFADRMLAGLNASSNLLAEFIIVEWNPPYDRISLSCYELPFRMNARVITVPARLHAGIEGHEVMPMFEYRAKNVGIRRSCGEFVLCTNADIVLSPEMVTALNGMEFDPDSFYIAQRHDMDRGKLQRIVPVGDAAGDFTLMSRDRWFSLRGYPEMLANDTIDSLMLELARNAGMRQVNLPYPIYHQEHDRSNQEGRPHGWDLKAEMNPDESWGLAGVALEET